MFYIQYIMQKTEDVIITDGMFAHLLVWLRPQTC